MYSIFLSPQMIGLILVMSIVFFTMLVIGWSWYRFYCTRQRVFKTKIKHLTYLLSLYRKIEKPTIEELTYISLMENRISLLEYFKTQWFSTAGTLEDTQLMPNLQHTFSTFIHRTLESSPILKNIQQLVTIYPTSIPPVTNYKVVLKKSK